MLMEYDNADQTLPAHISTQVRVTESNHLIIDEATVSPIPCSSGDSPAWTAIGRISSASAFTMHITEPFANT